ncbi:MAG: hypothetical protein WCT26_00340 [Candidatus Buchananbacteria bacterium]|jgi:hypothetical protein
MACFIAPAVAAMAVTAVNKKIPQKLHPEWLMSMLWGGTLMLIVDHIASGEIVPYLPFLTAANNPIAMLREILTLGVIMTAAIVVVWLAMVLIAGRNAKLHKQTLPLS